MQSHGATRPNSTPPTSNVPEEVAETSPQVAAHAETEPQDSSETGDAAMADEAEKGEK